MTYEERAAVIAEVHRLMVQLLVLTPGSADRPVDVVMRRYSELEEEQREERSRRLQEFTGEMPAMDTHPGVGF